MSRITTILLGFLMLLTGIFCIAHSGIAFISIAFIVGIIMILFGVVQAVIFMKKHKLDKKDNNLWIFSDAIVTFLLGLLILCDQMATDVAAPLVLGLWVISTGASRLAASYSINREEKKQNFFWAFGTGMLCVIAGLYSFTSAAFAPLPVVGITGVMFLVQAVCTFELGFHMPHSKDRVSDV